MFVRRTTKVSCFSSPAPIISAITSTASRSGNALAASLKERHIVPPLANTTGRLPLALSCREISIESHLAAVARTTAQRREG